VKQTVIIFEDSIKYDGWFKNLFFLPGLIFIILGVFFYLDSRGIDLFRGDPVQDSKTASLVCLAAAFLIIAILRQVFPQSVAVTQGGVLLKFKVCSWLIPFKTIFSIGPVPRNIFFYGYSWVTSSRNQIEINRKHRPKVRVCPANFQLFLEHAQRALADWRMTHPV